MLYPWPMAPQNPSSPGPSKADRWYADGLSFECTGCGDCCRHRGEYSYVYLREEEADAIAEYLGTSYDAFVAEHCERDDDWLTLRTDAPECAFLSEDSRCGIYAVRPVQCRTWPFWDHTLRRSVWEKDVLGTCPGAGKGVLHSADEVESIARATEDWYEGRTETWEGPEPRG